MLNTNIQKVGQFSSRTMALAYLISRTILICVVYMGCIVCADPDCVLKDMCSCEMSDGSGIVDLTSLGNKDNTPRFKDVKCGADGSYYSYNPCGAFQEQDCSDVALCGLSEDKSQAMPLGKADSVKFKYDSESGNVQAGYLILATPIGSSEIELICDKSACQPQFVPIGRKRGTLYKMQLTSICACPGMCTASGPTTDCSSSVAVSLSIGTFILIGFSCCLVLYLSIGISYQRVKKNASGKDLIPNRTTWSCLALYIVSGCKVVLCSVRRRDIQYSSI